MTKHTVGIDVSKAWLDVYDAPEGSAAQFSNDPAGFRKLIAWIGSEVDRIAYEPTGPFHRNLEDALLKAGLPLRCAGRGPGRHHQPRQALAHPRGQAAQQATAEADRAPAEAH